MTEKGKLFHIGCQSWQYDDWVTIAGGDPVFYPRGTRNSDMLELYSQVFDSIEVDSTAYGTPALSTITGWTESTPDNFLFSLKVPRAVTHEYGLSPHSFAMFDEFVDAARSFGPKLGVILLQFAAAFEATKENGQNLRDFLERLPTDVRFSVEFRNPGWLVDWTFDELAARGIPLALVAGKWIDEETMFAAFSRVRTDFAYLRFMGVRDLPTFDRIHRDRTDELERWAKKIGELRASEIFIYVDNYYEGHAPATANKLKEVLGEKAIDPSVLEPQASLF